jgi:hypothetical protein
MNGLAISNKGMKFQSPNPYQSKIWPTLKISKKKVNLQGQRVKIMVSNEKACQKKYTCEILKPYHIAFKSYNQG